VKEANNAGGTGQYALNSYAFHSRSLINTLCSFMPGFDRTKIESIFIEAKEAELEAANPLLITNTEEKVRRKRVLISSDYKTAYKVKNIFDVYYELNQSRWCTEKIQNKKFKQATQAAISDLSQRYQIGVYLQQPAQKKLIAKKICATESEDYDEEEQVVLKQ
jgi:hypothetical protein